MRKYRIAPDGADGWKAQTKWFGLFWANMYRGVAPDYYELVSFETESGAEASIVKILDYEFRNRQWHEQARTRKQVIAPRPFP